MSYVLYATELINQFTADHIENNPLFKLLIETMQQLCRGGDSELVLRYFELNLLERVGYRPQLSMCVSCRSPLESTINSFSPGSGGMLCSDCAHNSQHLTYPVSASGLKVLRLLQDSDYNIAGRLKMNPELSSELERLMRSYLRYLLEREIKSTAWLDTLRELRSKDQGALL